MADKAASNEFAQAREIIERELDVIAALFVKRGFELYRAREASGDMSRLNTMLPVDANGKVVPLDVKTLWTSCEERLEVVGMCFICINGKSRWAVIDDTLHSAFYVDETTLDKPIFDRDGERVFVGDTLYDADGRPHVVESVNPDYDGDEHTVFCGEYAESPLDDMSKGIPINRMVRDLSHTRFNVWDKLAYDVASCIRECDGMEGAER